MTTIDTRTASTTKTVHVAPAAGQTVTISGVSFVAAHDGPVNVQGYLTVAALGITDEPGPGASWGTGAGSGSSPCEVTLSGDTGDKLEFQADVDAVVTVTVEGP